MCSECVVYNVYFMHNIHVILSRKCSFFCSDIGMVTKPGDKKFNRVCIQSSRTAELAMTPALYCCTII